MNKLEEFNILELLYNYKNEKTSKDSSDFLLRNPDSVRILSEAITDVIYDSYEKSSSNHTREIIIELLKIFIKPCSHITDQLNNDMLIKILNKDSESETFFQKYGQDFIKSSKLFDLEKHERGNIYKTVNKKYVILLEKNITSGLIHSWHQNQFEKLNFDYTVQNKLFQSQNLENFLLLLQNLKTLPCELLQESEDNPQCKRDKIDEAPLKESFDFHLCYALLNFDRTEENIKLFKKILTTISFSRHDIGLQFIEYIWENKENLNLPASVYILILKHFKYLFEKPVINLVVDVLLHFKKESTDHEYELLVQQSNVENIFKICVLDIDLHWNISLIFNKLLALSKYDIRVLKLLKYVNKMLSNISQ